MPSSPKDRTQDAGGFTAGPNRLTGSISWRPITLHQPFPDRYTLRTEEDERYLLCVEAPELKVYVQRDSGVKALSARKYPEGSIFLDGAAQGEPFLDAERRVFNLDHHEGCVRAFTLATCEQAMVLTLRGLDLREQPWTIYANLPDLDTLLAIWVLLNGMHLMKEDPQIRRSIIPLLRLEGLIDAHGLELKELCGFPDDLYSATSEKLNILLEPELALKEEEKWDQIDFLEYTAQQLRAIDRMVYPADYFEGLRSVEELGRVALTERRIAVLCRSDLGIYELESDLKKLYGRRLGLIVQQKDPRTYTLRQVDPFLPADLELVYDQLNVLDPAVSSVDSENRWGGSGEIGGSPRQKGSSLRPQEIAYACVQAFRKPTLFQRAATLGLAFLVSAAGLLAGWSGVLVGYWQTSNLRELFVRQQAEFVGAVLTASALALLLFARRRPRLYGLRFPGGWDWLLLIPPAVVGGFAGGTWTAFGPYEGPSLIVLLGLPLIAELVFRSLTHGILSRDFKSQHSGGPWLVSWPVAISALLYALWTISPNMYQLIALPSFLPASWTPWLVPTGVVVFGLAAGTARERSGSVLAPLLMHYLCVAMVIAFA